MHRMMAVARGSGRTFTPTPTPAEWANAASIAADLEAVFPNNAYTITHGGSTGEEGFMPASSVYDFGIWTADQAYTIWHYPTLLTATQRRQFVTHRLGHRNASDFVPGLINSVDTASFQYRGTLPTFGEIAWVILALWADWDLTGDDSTFIAQQSVIDDCLAAIPRSVNGCVWSDPAGTSADSGFYEDNQKSGDMAYGTAVQAWAYKMCAEMAGESGSGTYTTLRQEAETGLATLRQPDGWYQGSSGNQSAIDDVWATALIVAEELVSGTDRTDSAETLRDAYLAGTITDSGYVRHAVEGQFWVDSFSAQGTYQNGGYWLLPLWDCYRAVSLIDQSTAVAWVQEALDTIESEIAAYGATNAPTEWRNGATVSTPKGYTCHAAMVQRFL